MTTDPLDDELNRMAGDPKVAKAVKEGLQRLSKGAGGQDLQEMAQELLAGRTSLRTVGSSSAYAAQLTAATAAFLQWRAELSPEERNDMERAAGEEFGVRPSPATSRQGPGSALDAGPARTQQGNRCRATRKQGTSLSAVDNPLFDVAGEPYLACM
jgi:hypothetical protein